MRRAMLLVLGVVLLSGCALTGNKANEDSFEGETHAMSEWVKPYRKPDGAVRGFGLSSKSQEIERSLGAH